MNKYFKTTLLLVVVFIFTRCQEDRPEFSETSPSPETIASEQSYLSFPNEQTLKDYVDIARRALEDNPSPDMVLASIRSQVPVPDHFVPMALRNSQSQVSLSEDGIDGESEVNVEQEMDFFLVPEEELHYVLDTERRVKVGDEIYQITEAGTFFYQEAFEEEFEKLYQDFPDKYLAFNSKNGIDTYTYGNVGFADTYSYVKNQNLTVGEVIGRFTGDIEPEIGAQPQSIPEFYHVTLVGAGNYQINSNFTSDYGLRNTSMPSNLLNDLGLFTWRSRNHDNRHRAQVSLFSLNYLFYKSAGFKVRFQQKRDIRACVRVFGRRCVTVGHYWTKRTATDMVIGFDYFQGYTKLPFKFNEFDTYEWGLRNTTKRWSNTLANFVFKGAGAETRDELRDWASNINLFGGTVTSTDQVITKGAFDLGFNWLKGQFANESDKMVRGLAFQNYETPKIAILPGNGEYYGDRLYQVFNGVSPYKNRSEKKIRFGGGHTIGVKFKMKENNNFWPPSFPGPYTPFAFKIEKAAVFGAVKHNGKWVGVRMTK